MALARSHSVLTAGVTGSAPNLTSSVATHQVCSSSSGVDLLDEGRVDLGSHRPLELHRRRQAVVVRREGVSDEAVLFGRLESDELPLSE